MKLRRHVCLFVACAATAVSLGSGAGTRFRYSITDLGTFGGVTSIATEINEHGQVVGGADGPDGWRHPFLWEDGQLIDLGNIAPGVSHEGAAISESGIIAGYVSDGGGIGAAFLYSSGTIVELSPAGQPKSAFGINDSHQVVGQAIFTGPNNGKKAYLWMNGVITNLGTLGGLESLARAINNAGQITGRSEASATTAHAFIWQDGVFTDLGTLGGTVSEGEDINEQGDVVGYSRWTTTTSTLRAFLWKDGQMIDLDGGAFSSSRARAINNHGQIVGTKTPGGAYMRDPLYGFIDLIDSLSPNPGWTWLDPRDINDAGQIVGWGYNAQGVARAFLMNPLPPIPAMSGWGMLAAAMGLMVLGSFVLRRRSAA